MKMKYWVIIMILIIAAGYFGCSYYLRDDGYLRVDMNDINDRYTEVCSRLNDSEKCSSSNDNFEKLEKDYDCQIVMRTDQLYETTVNNAIANQMIVMDYMKDNQLAGKVMFDGQAEKLNELRNTTVNRLQHLFIYIAIAVAVLFIWVYWSYIRPFRKLEVFAAQISKGNLDFPLQVSKNNYFGKFTESFDIMREELSKARRGEFEANRSKKELVASLSHDIKTPVATIKAICEILMLKVKDELVLEKVMVICQRADTIDSLISNLFHATLEELNLLKIIPTEVKSTDIVTFFNEINYDGKIHFMNDIPECLVIADSLRINQVIDNVINNSYKYAGTDIEVSFADMKDSITIAVRDFGCGVPDTELPLLTEKFYRGSNTDNKDGSGLGMYLSDLFMKGMQGNFEFENTEAGTGFTVTLTLKKV